MLEKSTMLPFALKVCVWCQLPYVVSQHLRRFSELPRMCRWHENVLAVHDPRFQPASDEDRGDDKFVPEPNPWLLQLGVHKEVCREVLNPGIPNLLSPDLSTQTTDSNLVHVEPVYDCRGILCDACSFEAVW